jgi:hypothetical protein
MGRRRINLNKIPQKSIAEIQRNRRRRRKRKRMEI